MGTTRIYFIAAVLLIVLNGACLVKGTTTDIVTAIITFTTSYSTSNDSSTSGMNNGYSTSVDSSTSSMNSGYSTSNDSSTSGMNNGNTTTTVPADNSASSNKPDSGAGLRFNKIGTSKTKITCLVCQGDNSSNCNHASPTSDMEDISEQSGCRSCRIYKSDMGEGTNLTQIVRECNQTSCPTNLKVEDDFRCLENPTNRTCEWCCEDDNCNNFNRNSADALVAAVVLGDWTITKVVYVVVSTIAVAMSMSTMV